MEPIKFKLPGWSRYYFTSDGKCFNDALKTEMSKEVVKWGDKGEYYRPTNDFGKRAVIYVSEIIEHGKKRLAEIKANEPKKSVKKEYPKQKLRFSDAENIRLLHIAGEEIKSIAAKYGRSASTIKQILNNTIFPIS